MLSTIYIDGFYEVPIMARILVLFIHSNVYICVLTTVIFQVASGDVQVINSNQLFVYVFDVRL